MTANKLSHYLPKLRFPEFREDPIWSAPLLAELYDFKRTNNLPRDELNYIAGTIKNIHYGDVHTKFKPLFRVENEHVPYINPGTRPNEFSDDAFCEEGDIVLADASEDLGDVGKAIEVVSLDGERVVAGTHTILATRRGSVPVVGFGGQVFQSAAVRAGIRNEAQGAKVYGISANRISAVPVPVPPTEAEQQKIADCLGALDDLIAAEGRKLEVLRQYRQGLMQQLFPQPGEAAPRLRFPEFVNEAWDSTTLGTLVSETERPIVMDDETEYALVTVKRRYGGVVARKVLKGKAISVKSQFLIEANDFLISKRQIVHNACGLVPAELAGSIVSNEYSVLTANNGCDIEFFNYFTQQPCVSDSFLQSSVGIVIEKMLFKLDWWLKLAFPFPSFAEQQRIAACLSWLDSRLALQAQKLEGLKRHKQGLLQQLFPSLEEEAR
ncbi:restriction endonuclease subunit S [Bradyrhizobium sp. 8-10B]|uniref:restriction endonuclease subunit S n=1 Tax=Bradyrhizobium sp. 8-10B TaxID=3344579 RepID=UPI0035C20435